MSLDYRTGSNLRKNFMKSTNHLILKEFKSLVKHEKYILETENDQLRKNNEELTIKIQDLYDEFDTNTRIFFGNDHKYTDAIDHVKHSKNRSKRSQMKSSPVLRMVQSNLKSQLMTSQDSVSVMKLQNQMSDVHSERKEKEIELLEAQNAILQDKIKNIENVNKDLQKEYSLMTKSTMKNDQKKILKQREHRDVGLSVSYDLKLVSKTQLLNSELKSSENPSPTYTDIFDNREKAFSFNHKHQNMNEKDSSQFFTPGTLTGQMPRNLQLIQETPLSPIYVDVNSMRKQKLYTTETLPHINIGPENNNKSVYNTENSSYPLEVEKEFFKLSHEHQQLNDKLDQIGSNYKIQQIEVKNDENEILLKKTSDEVVKISAEQQQIIDLLVQNSTVLNELHEMRESIIRNNQYTQNGTYGTLFNENENIKDKALKHLSCQTDVTEMAENKSKIKLPAMENDSDILKLINDQNEKIRDLTDRFSLIQSTCQSVKNTDDLKLSDQLFDMMENDENVSIKSENSFDDISNITDLVQPNSYQVVSTFLPKQDETKSITSLILSTSDSKFTNSSEFIANVIGQYNNDSFDNVENLPLETLYIPEKDIHIAVGCAPSETHSITSKRISSKIPRLISSKSLDFTDNKMIGVVPKLYTNDLESSYETLYDPVSSARYEKENTVPI